MSDKPRGKREIGAPNNNLLAPGSQWRVRLAACLALLLLGLLAAVIASPPARAAWASRSTTAFRDATAGLESPPVTTQPAPVEGEALAANVSQLASLSSQPTRLQTWQGAASAATEMENAQDDVWKLEEVLLSGTECDTSFASYKQLPIGTGSASAGCTLEEDGGTSTVLGTLSFSYPLQLTYEEPGTFSAQASGTFQWSMPRRGRARLRARMEGDIFRFGKGCEVDESIWTEYLGSTDSASLQWSATCAYDSNWWFGDEAWFGFWVTTTGSDGHYCFTGVPGLGTDQITYVRYLNTDTDPNPGPGYLWSWSATRITTYTAGEAVPGGDFDVEDISLVSPANGASVTLPATFCWDRRGATSDNYRLVVYNPATDTIGVTTYLGYVSCVNLTGLPAGWPSGATYGWWLRAYQGDDPDALPYNNGASYGARAVTISYTASSSDSVQGEPLLLGDDGAGDLWFRAAP